MMPLLLIHEMLSNIHSTVNDGFDFDRVTVGCIEDQMLHVPELEPAWFPFIG
jgi:hypothetical protein